MISILSTENSSLLVVVTTAAVLTTAAVFLLPMLIFRWTATTNQEESCCSPSNHPQKESLSCCSPPNHPKKESLSFCSPPNHPQNKRLPGCFPCGYIETTKKIGSPQGVWFMVEWAKQVGRTVFRVPVLHPSPVFVVGDPDLARAILQDPTTTKPYAFYGALDITVGEPSVFTANGERWRHARKAVAPAFAKAHIERMNRVCHDKFDDWIHHRLEVASETGQPLDIPQELVSLTLSIISKAAMEYDMTEAEAALFVQESDLSIREFLVRQGSNPLRKTWLGYCMYGKVIRRAEQANRNMQSMAKNILNNYRRNQTKDKETGTVIEYIVKNPHYKNDDDRIADILVFLIAGHDTTAYTISWALLELARNPHVMDQVRNELMRCRTNEERLSCPALDHLIQEAMRLHPVAATYLRQVHRDFPVNDDTSTTVIAKGSVVFISNLIMHRHPQYFDRPDEFIPTRWEKATKEDAVRVTRALHALAPFSLGPRNCIGQALANAELHTVLARLIVDFDFEVVDPGIAECTLTLKPTGLKLKAIKRTNVQQQ